MATNVTYYFKNINMQHILVVCQPSFTIKNLALYGLSATYFVGMAEDVAKTPEPIGEPWMQNLDSAYTFE